MQGQCGELLKEVNKEIKNWKTKKGAKSVILVCDAQVEFQPNEEPFNGCGPRGGKTKNIQPGDAELQADFFKLQQQRRNLNNTFMATHSPSCLEQTAGKLWRIR